MLSLRVRVFILNKIYERYKTFYSNKKLNQQNNVKFGIDVFDAILLHFLLYEGAFNVLSEFHLEEFKKYFKVLQDTTKYQIK